MLTWILGPPVNERLTPNNKSFATRVYERMVNSWKALEPEDVTAHAQLHSLTNIYGFLRAFTPVLKGLLQESTNMGDAFAVNSFEGLLEKSENAVSYF